MFCWFQYHSLSVLLPVDFSKQNITRILLPPQYLTTRAMLMLVSHNLTTSFYQISVSKISQMPCFYHTISQHDFIFISVYKSPQFEQLGFDLIRQRLVQIGYPETINDFQYDQTFPIRCVPISFIPVLYFVQQIIIYTFQYILLSYWMIITNTSTFLIIDKNIEILSFVLSNMDAL